MRMQALATLASVVRLGSFAAAAEHVSLTPSAVSLQMKQLEEYFGQPLFDRSGRQARPTPLAHRLARTVDRTLAELQGMRDVADLEPAGTVRLGVTDSVMTTLLPQALARLQHSAPQLRMQLRRGTTPDLLQGVKAGDIDAAVLIRPPTGGSSRLHWTPLASEPFVLVLPHDAPGRDVAQLLRGHRWIRMDRSLVAGQIAARYVDRLLPQHPAWMDVPSMDAIVAMIDMGMGVSVLPQLRPQLRAGFAVRELALGRGAPMRHVALVRRAADEGNRRLQAVQQALVLAAGEG